jgi:hypothetical protein
MVKLVGRRTGVVVDTEDLAQDGAFDDLDAFWAAAAQPAWDNDGQDVARQEPEDDRRVSFAGSVDALEALDEPPAFGNDSDDDLPQSPMNDSDGEEVVARQARTPDSRRRPYEPPQPDPSAEGLRRSRRARFPVMKWWKGERVIYEPDSQTGLQKVAAVQLGAPTPRPKKRPRHLTKKIGGIIMDDTPLQPSDYESDTQGTEARLWNEGSQHAQTTKFAARFSEHRFSALPTEDDEPAVMACQAIATAEDAARDDVYPGWASGVMELPMGGVKGSESTGSLTMLFFVSTSQNLAVELTLYQSEDAVVTDPHESEALRFQFSPGDQFYVPPNNTYRLMNRSTTQPAKLFFAMLRPVCDHDDSSSSG